MLLFAGQPAPPMPDFELDPKYQDAEALADMIDDVFGKSGGKDDYNEEERKSWDEADDDKSSEIEKESETTVTDIEATTLCTEWKTKYSVVQGVSWGNLPYDLQVSFTVLLHIIDIMLDLLCYDSKIIISIMMYNYHVMIRLNLQVW